MRQIVVSILAAIVGFLLAKATIGVRRGVVKTEPSVHSVIEQSAGEIPERVRQTPLGSAVQTVARIDGMTLADFQAIVEDPKKFPDLDESLSRWGLGDSYLDALVERWLEVDPAGGFAAIQKVAIAMLAARPDHSWPSLYLRSALARHRPAEMLASLPDKLEDNQLWHGAFPAMKALAKRDIRAAHAALERFTNKQHRESLEYALAEGLAENDPVAAAAFARQKGSTEKFNVAFLAASRIGRETMRQVIAAGGEKLRPEGDFTELMLRYPDENWDAILGGARDSTPVIDYPRLIEAVRLPADERLKRLEQFDQYSKNRGRAASDSLMRAWTLENPAEALNWALSKSGDTTDGRLRTAFDCWMNDNLAAARAWHSQLPDSAQRVELGNQLAWRLARKGDAESALALFVPGPGTESAQTMRQIAFAKSNADHAAAAEWLLSLPPEAASHNAIEPVMRYWFQQDPSAAAAWAEALPNGQMRDNSLAGLTSAIEGKDPFVAAEWVGTIDDPKTKMNIATSVYLNMNRYDPAAGRKWLRTLPDIDPVWRDHFLKLSRW